MYGYESNSSDSVYLTADSVAVDPGRSILRVSYKLNGTLIKTEFPLLRHCLCKDCNSVVSAYGLGSIRDREELAPLFDRELFDRPWKHRHHWKLLDTKDGFALVATNGHNFSLSCSGRGTYYLSPRCDSDKRVLVVPPRSPLTAAKPKPKPQVGPRKKPRKKPLPELTAEVVTVATAVSPEPKPVPQTELVALAQTEPMAELRAEQVTAALAEPKAELQTVAVAPEAPEAPEPKTAPVASDPELRAEPVAEAPAEPKPELQATPVAEAKPEPAPAPQATPPTEIPGEFNYGLFADPPMPIIARPQWRQQ